MSRTVRQTAAARWAPAVLCVSGALGVAGVLGETAHAQPASSQQSSWNNLALPTDPPLVDATLQRGREVFYARCIGCHGPIPEQTLGRIFVPPMPGTQALLTRYRGEVPPELERRTDLTPALVETVVRKGLGSMPFFRPTEVSRDDLAALAAYLTRNRN